LLRQEIYINILKSNLFTRPFVRPPFVRASLTIAFALLVFAAIVFINAKSVVAQPAPIDLGLATSFSVLAGSSLTNSNPTNLYGDLGSPSQNVTPSFVGGTNYLSGPILNDALNDLKLAITDANSRTANVNSASAVDLGGLILTPGVYTFDGAISVTGTLTLDAQNDPSAMFIFRTKLTLNTTANSIIQMINGGNPCQVFFVPVGASTLGANSSFIGSILSHSAPITVGDNSNIVGRALSGAAVSLARNTIGSCTLAPTAATVSISGRVTSSAGRGIRNVRVSLTNSSGQVRTAKTTTFGYYQFNDVQAGETYFLSATGKHYTFSQTVQVLNINEETNQIDFIATLKKD
jgi:hypothetical protein